MKKVNPKLGKQGIHSFACYDDVWKDLHVLREEFKKQYGSKSSLDKVMRYLINFYRNNSLQVLKDEKRAANKYFDDKIESLKKESKKM